VRGGGSSKVLPRLAFTIDRAAAVWQRSLAALSISDHIWLFTCLVDSLRDHSWHSCAAHAARVRRFFIASNPPEGCRAVRSCSGCLMVA